MNLTIWKFPIDKITMETKIEMPIDAKILTVRIQNQVPTIWAVVDPRKVKVKRTIQIAGTGHELSERILGDYIGTIQEDSLLGELVWHFFDGGEDL